MSSEPVLSFTRRLRRVRSIERAEAADKEQERPVRSVEELQLAELRDRLAERAAELDRREQDLARKEAALQERLDDLAELIGSVQEERAEILESSEEEIVSFSLKITEKVLQHEIEQGRYKIGQVVKSALQAVRDKGSVVVRVNPDDYDMTRAALEKIGQTYGRTQMTAVPDESIARASCCIETDSGKIFSEIPGRLARIEQSLLRNGESNGV
ncbi:MAG: FliH/SctL family protein [Candidatus Brocadiia bacterium]|jgi:flagellar biosynthesis/type III secretory pathway protein FliH